MNKHSMSYEEAVRQDLPRVTVGYICGDGGDKDAYSFKVGSDILAPRLIGFITRVQAELAFKAALPCEANTFAIAADPRTGEMYWFCDPCIPVDDLVGWLEILKQTFVMNEMQRVAHAQQQKQQTGLFGPDGSPIRRR